MWMKSKQWLEDVARGVPSPDEWDAVALTLAEPVRDGAKNFNRKIEYPRPSVA